MKEVEEYLEHLEVRGRADRTIESKRKVIMTMTRFLEKNGRNYMPMDITMADIRFYLKNADVKEITKKTYMREFGAYLKFHQGKDIIAEMDLLWNRYDRYRLFITKEDMLKVYQTAEPRTRLIIILGAFMGLRTVEMERMRWADISIDYIEVRGKGHNGGLMLNQPMSEVAWDELMRYKEWTMNVLKLTGYKDETNGYVFFKYDKENKRIVPMVEGQLRIHRLLKYAGDKAEIRITPHALRRLYATTLFYDYNVDIVTLKSLMRHASVNTTFDNYVIPFDKKRREATDKLDMQLKPLVKERIEYIESRGKTM